ncbi:MAG: hypothetical protein EOP49_29900 [Sphingobacteriales bacterium]|nr:MAG: hypothetical protein EOP49_29900 [Sphingobacteriales bacterium]
MSAFQKVSVLAGTARALHRLLIAFMLLVSLLQGCGNATRSYIDKLDGFISSCEQHQTSYTEANWRDMDRRYQWFAEEGLDELRPLLTDAQQLRINELLGRYQTLKVKRTLRNWATKTTDFVQQTKSLIDQLSNDTIQPKQ